jgi:spore maturation protein CgeB
MRILVGYSCGRSYVSVKDLYEGWATRLRQAGLAVDVFCLTLNPPGERLSWRELNKRWRFGDIHLMSLYEDLVRRLENYDVFLNYNGINLHPEFVALLPTFNVYSCFDDPESSEDLSKPVAAAYDLAMVGNIAEVDTYRTWGVKEVRWWPLGFRAYDFDPKLTRDRILSGSREVDVALLCERVTQFRHRRIDALVHAFPRGAYYGPGWPNGILPEEMRVPLFQQTKIGINVHNSSGPINFRTFYLPANGVLQICDNKSHLSRIYDLNREVIGYDKIEEAVDLCRYYLAHDEERREIAAAGWERALCDYNEVTCFRRLISVVCELFSNRETRSSERRWNIEVHLSRTRTLRALHGLTGPLSRSADFLARGLRGLSRRSPNGSHILSCFLTDKKLRCTKIKPNVRES